MAIIYSTTLSTATYIQRLKAFMQAVEGTEYVPYIDSANPGVPTIGWGFAMSAGHVVDAGRGYIYATVLGVDPSRSGLSAAGSASELGFQKQLTAVFNQT